MATLVHKRRVYQKKVLIRGAHIPLKRLDQEGRGQR